MAKKKVPRRSRRIQDYGYRAISLYLPEDLYQALRKMAFDEERKHAQILREVLTAELKKKGYLK